MFASPCRTLPPLSTPDSDPRDKEYSSLLDKGRDEGERISVPPSCISANHPSQMTTGAGRAETRTSGKRWRRTTCTRDSTITGTSPPTILARPNRSSPINSRSELFHLSTRLLHRARKLSSPNHIMKCTTAYCPSAKLRNQIRES